MHRATSFAIACLLHSVGTFMIRFIEVMTIESLPGGWIRAEFAYQLVLSFATKLARHAIYYHVAAFGRGFHFCFYFFFHAIDHSIAEAVRILLIGLNDFRRYRVAFLAVCKEEGRKNNK